MYTGNNITALRSQQMLAEAVMELMETTEYSKMNVKEICTKAALSRQTFYQLFDTKEEAVLYCVKKQFNREEMEPDMVKFNRILEYVARKAEENRDLMVLLEENHLEYVLYEVLAKELDALADCIEAGHGRKTGKIAHSFIKGALVHSLFAWIREDDLPKEEFVKAFGKILKGNYYRIK